MSTMRQINKRSRRTMDIIHKHAHAHIHAANQKCQWSIKASKKEIDREPELVLSASAPRRKTEISLGTYPQTRITDEALTEILMGKAGTLPTKNNGYAWTESKTDRQNSYRIWYIDVTHEGTNYRGVYVAEGRPWKRIITWDDFSPSKSECELYAKGAKIGHPEKNGYDTSNAYWFRYEPIVWDVVAETDEQILVLSKYILDCQCFLKGAIKEKRKVGEDKVFANNYEYSSIRVWLNETFYDTAFTEDDKTRIVKAVVPNGGCGKYSCRDTEDVVFLLSEKEANAPEYKMTKEDKKTATEYALCHGCLPDDGWWYRTPYAGTKAFEARCCHVGSTSVGVAPAMIIRK